MIAATAEVWWYLAAFGVSLVVTLLATPIAARAAVRLDVLDRPGGHKAHLAATPYLGGVAVAGGLVLVGALTGGTNGELLTILVGAIAMGALGLVDDLRTVPPAIRLILELAYGLSLWLVGVQAGVFGAAPVDLAITLLWVAAVINAFNIVDNMDGLAAGVSAASSLGIAVIAALEGDYLVGGAAFAVAGASLGFLYSNLPPARIFLGDAGSMLLGAWIAALTLKLDLEVGEDAARLVAITLLAAVPLFDLSLVIVGRAIGRRPVWIGGRDHTSHRLAERGRSPRAIAGIFGGAQALCSLLAIWVYGRSNAAAIVVGAIGGIVWVALLVAILRFPHPQPGDDPEALRPPPTTPA